MNEQLIKIQRHIEKEETIYKQLEKRLHTNSIRNRFNQFVTSKLKSSVLDILKNQ